MALNPLFDGWTAVALAGLLGLMVGSFLNVVAHRLPTILQYRWEAEAHAQLGTQPPPFEEPNRQPYNLAWPPSHCPQCQRRLRAWENLPLISYLWQRGRCRGCRQPIPLRYPAVEAASATASAVTVALLGASIETAIVLALTWTLIAAATIDLQHYLLPDALTLPLLWAGLLWSTTPLAVVATSDAVIGAAVGYLSLWLLYHTHRLITGREGMGYGDFKLTAALGAWLGWQMLPMLVLLAALGGLIIGLSLLVLHRRSLRRALPFGPCLAGAGWLLLVAGEPLGNWLEGYALLAG